MMASSSARLCLLPIPAVAASLAFSELGKSGCKVNSRSPVASVQMVGRHGRRCPSSLQCEVKQPDKFADRLRKETQILLSRQLGMAAEGCPIPDALIGLQAPELVELFRHVEELVAAVDALAADWPARHWGPSRIPGVAVAPVRATYSDLLQSVGAVSEAIMGLHARPMAETQWWAPLLTRWRYYVCSLYSWGLLPEPVVQQAADLLRELKVAGVVDPLAGSGWHARLWQDAGNVGAVALDAFALQPVSWTKVQIVEDSRNMPSWGLDINGASGIDRWALFLSWPPHSPETVGVDLLRRWPGRVLVYLGERGMADALGGHGDDGLTGGRALLEELDAKWKPLRSWAIPQWPGYGDDMTIYVRK